MGFSHIIAANLFFSFFTLGLAQQAGQSLHEQGPDAPGAVSLHWKILPFINSGTVSGSGVVLTSMGKGTKEFTSLSVKNRSQLVALQPPSQLPQIISRAY